MDEEEKEKGENREERRYLDKQNKVARQQRKKEEMSRIRQLVDNAYQCDPRVARFKEDEKKRKQDAKSAKQASIKAKKEEEERQQKLKEEQELARQKELEDEKKQKKEEERKQKDALKKRVKKEVKLLESLLQKENYFADDDATKIEHMKDADKLTKLYDLEAIVELRNSLEKLNNSQDRKSLFLSKLEEMNQKLESERQKHLNVSTNTSTTTTVNSKKVWSYDDIQILIKAVKLFPAGTQNRWTVVANYVNEKSSSGVNRTHRDALEKAKELQQSSKSIDSICLQSFDHFPLLQMILKT